MLVTDYIFRRSPSSWQGVGSSRLFGCSWWVYICSLPEFSNLPSVFGFAECISSDTRRTSSLLSAATKKTLGKFEFTKDCSKKNISLLVQVLDHIFAYESCLQKLASQRATSRAFSGRSIGHADGLDRASRGHFSKNPFDFLEINPRSRGPLSIFFKKHIRLF